MMNYCHGYHLGWVVCWTEPGRSGRSAAMAASFIGLAANFVGFFLKKRNHMVNFAKAHVFFANTHIKNYHRREKMLAQFLMTDNFAVHFLHTYES